MRKKKKIEQSQVVIWDVEFNIHFLIGKHYLHSFFPLEININDYFYNWILKGKELIEKQFYIERQMFASLGQGLFIFSSLYLLVYFACLF